MKLIGKNASERMWYIFNGFTAAVYPEEWRDL
jgi:hypothetical protein